MSMPMTFWDHSLHAFYADKTLSTITPDFNPLTPNDSSCMCNALFIFNHSIVKVVYSTPLCTNEPQNNSKVMKTDSGK